jgi:hypothetical protein
LYREERRRKQQLVEEEIELIEGNFKMTELTTDLNTDSNNPVGRENGMVYEGWDRITEIP